MSTPLGNGWRVAIRESEGTLLGAGVVLPSRHVLTCAHVLGPPREPMPPGRRVDVIGSTGAVSAVIEQWLPVEDLAVLRPETPISWPAATFSGDVRPGQTVRVFGYPARIPDGVWIEARSIGAAGADGGLIQVNATTGQFESGFSGAGVERGDGSVIGILLSYTRDATSVGRLIPVAAMEAASPQLAALIRGQTAGRPSRLTEIVAALLELPTMMEPRSRDLIVSNLQAEIGVAVPRSTAAGPDMENIVRTALRFPDGLQHLIDVVELLLGPEANGDRLRRLAEEAREAPADQSVAAAVESGAARYPGYVSDLAGGPDLLDRGSHVAALATLIAARATEPPLSIGLFGEWGTGKTFFITRLQEEIRSLGRLAAQAPPGTPNAMCPEVRQIVFNAWHYTDANLWASLVAEIFTELAEPRSGESADAAAQRWRAERERLVGELESTRQELAEAETRLGLAQAEAERLETALAGLERRREEGRNILATLTAVAGTVLEDPDLREPLDEVRREVVLREGEELHQLRGLTDDGVTTFRRVARLWRMMAPGGRDAIRWRVWAGGVAAVVLCIAVPVAVAAVAPAAVQLLSGLVALLVPLVLAGRGVIAVIGRALGAAERVADTARKVQRRLAEHRSAEERAVLAELQRLEEQEAAVRQEILAAEARVVDAERALDEARSGRQLTDFLRERGASADYRSQLGTIAMIRRDFQRLDELLRGPADGEVRAIDRIVLYIDDLDRCPPDRVVDVLQAVHLLLGLRLFVVVVAVDPRWLLGSLEQHFERVLGRRAAGDERHWAATPTNYLEKIFQIPYRIAPMDDTGFARMVDHLATAPPVTPMPLAAAVTVTSDQPAPVAPERLEEGPPAIPDDPSVPPAGEWDRLEPGWLSLSPAELAFLRRLGRLVGTPRAGKRLLNLYRLIRATLHTDALSAREAHQAVLLLLGIIVGAPTRASDVFAALLDSQDAELWYSVVTRCVPAGELVQTLGRLNEGMPAAIPVASLRPWVPVVAQYSFHTARMSGAE